MSNEPHLPVLGTIYIIVGALNLMIAALFFATIYSQAVTAVDPRSVMDRMTSDIRLVVASISLLAGVLTLVGGIGLRKRRSWAWGLVWVLACMSLFSFPIGTALGAYALWVLTRPEVRQSLGVDANGSSVMRAIKITAVLSLLLIVASYPACRFTEPIVQAELSKLSPEERELRQFDMVYLRWALPGVLSFFWGCMLGVVAFISWIVERKRIPRRMV